MTKRWQLVSLLGLESLEAIFGDSPWSREAREIADQLEHAVAGQDRAFLDLDVPREMAVFGLAVAGLIAYRGSDGWLRTNPVHGGTPVPLASVLYRYGGDLAEELLEKASVREPIKDVP